MLLLRARKDLPNCGRGSSISHPSPSRQLANVKSLLVEPDSSQDRDHGGALELVSPNKGKEITAVLVSTQGRKSAGIATKLGIWPIIFPNQGEKGPADRITNQPVPRWLVVHAETTTLSPEILDDPL